MNEYEGRTIPCSDDDVAISVGDSQDCPLPGDSVYESIGFEGAFANYVFNIFVCALLNLFFLVGAYVMLRRSK